MKNSTLAALLSCSVVSGIIIGRLSKPSKKENKPLILGTVVIDRSDSEDKPYIFLELMTSIRQLEMNNTVTFDVKSKNYISQ